VDHFNKEKLRSKCGTGAQRAKQMDLMEHKVNQEQMDLTRHKVKSGTNGTDGAKVKQEQMESDGAQGEK
jgi:hypothetical protein